MQRKKKKVARKKRQRICLQEDAVYIAVVCKADAVYGEGSDRPMGDWASFVGPDQETVIQKALVSRDEWERNGKFGPYLILIGRVEARVDVPQPKYTLTPTNGVAVTKNLCIKKESDQCR